MAGLKETEVTRKGTAVYLLPGGSQWLREGYRAGFGVTRGEMCGRSQRLTSKPSNSPRYSSFLTAR